MKKLLVLCALAACSNDPIVFGPPVRDGIDTYLLILFEGESTRAHVLAADAPFSVETEDLDALSIEAFGYPASTGLTPGPFAVSTTGVSLPTPRAFFASDLDVPGWTLVDQPSDRAAALKTPRNDACSGVDARTEKLATTDYSGIRAILEVEPDARLVISASAWFRVTAAETTLAPKLVEDAESAAVDPEGTAFVATDREMYVMKDGVATLGWTFPGRIAPFVMAAPRPGVVYLIDTRGRFFRTQSSTTTLLHQFEYPSAHTRGQVLVIGDHVAAGVGTDPSFIEVDALDRIRTFTLPIPSEGVVSLARYGDYGFVVGTNQGLLRAQSLAFAELPDPLGQMPRGNTLRALQVIGDRLYFGGNSGVFGEVTPSGLICTASDKASSGIRFLSRLGDEIIAAGVVLDVAPMDVNLTRFRITP